MELTFEEVRVLGCLVEKAANTPEHYPLTTNSLVAACNQKTSREPVVSFSAREVDEVVMSLRLAGLARTNAGGRSAKHRHVVEESLGLTTNEAIVLSVLMLRGPQSAGELRTRTDRAIGFTDVADIEAILLTLGQRDEPLVQDIGRGSGQSQNRWSHLLGGDVEGGSHPDVHALDDGRPDGSTAAGASLVERVVDLERRLALMEDALGMHGELTDESPTGAPEASLASETIVEF